MILIQSVIPGYHSCQYQMQTIKITGLSGLQSVKRLRIAPCEFLDAITSVGLHMSVGRLGSLLMMEFLTDEHSVRSTVDGISLGINSILVSTAHWPTDVSFSLAN